QTEYLIDVDEKKLEESNIPKAHLFQTVSQLFSDQPLGELAQEGETLPIKLKNSTDIDNREQLLKQKIMTTNGEKKLSSFITLNETTSPAQIDRFDGERYVSIIADHEGSDLGQIHTDINHLLKNL